MILVALLALPLLGALAMLLAPGRIGRPRRGAPPWPRAPAGSPRRRAAATGSEGATRGEGASGAEDAPEGPLPGATRGDAAPEGALPGATGAGVAGVFGLVVSGAALLVAVVGAAAFDYARPGQPQLGVDIPWAPAIGLRLHLGVDGVSLPLVLLTALLTFLCMVYTLRYPPAGGSQRALVGLLLLLEVGMLGTFVALDLLLFFVFFEAVLIPMYFVIAIWGGPGRRPAAIKFILYTLLGSGVLLVGLLVIAASAGSLDMVELARRQGGGLSHGAQILAFGLVGLGLAVKSPMWPLHTWLPDAHTEAPTVGSVLLAGVLLKMGTYGFVRIALPMAPEGATFWAPWLGFLAVAGIIYGAMACLAQRELKRLVAFSSVGHMGFVLLGIATLTPVGVNAALFGNIAHGLITGLLFFLAGAVKERYGSGELSRLGGGMLAKAPYLAAVLTFAAVAGLGLPGLAGFWGEMLALLGAYDPGPGLPRERFLTFMVVGGLGAVLTAAYFLRLLAKITHGRVAAPWRQAGFGDLTACELVAWTPLITATVVVGLWPRTLLGLTDAPVRALLGGG